MIVNHEKREYVKKMKQNYKPLDTIFWQQQHDPIVPCDKDLQVDVAIVGGGMAGLSAAQVAMARGIRLAQGYRLPQRLDDTAVEHLFAGRTDLDHCFNPYRKYPISGFAQIILGTTLSFALSNVIKQNIP